MGVLGVYLTTNVLFFSQLLSVKYRRMRRLALQLRYRVARTVWHVRRPFRRERMHRHDSFRTLLQEVAHSTRDITATAATDRLR